MKTSANQSINELLAFTPEQSLEINNIEVPADTPADFILLEKINLYWGIELPTPSVEIERS